MVCMPFSIRMAILGTHHITPQSTRTEYIESAVHKENNSHWNAEYNYHIHIIIIIAINIEYVCVRVGICYTSAKRFMQITCVCARPTEWVRVFETILYDSVGIP